MSTSQDFDAIRYLAQSVYTDMLHDADRNEEYEAALVQAIAHFKQRKKATVVLNIGTAAGLLSMMALRHGSDVVYACDAFPPAIHLAKDVITDNRCSAEKVTWIMKHSTDVTVDEHDGDMKQKANILISELFDTELIGEGALNSFRHAVENLLTPDCIIIPHGAKVHVLAVESRFLRSHHFYTDDSDPISYPEFMKSCPGTASLHNIQASELIEGKNIKLLTQPLCVSEFVFRDVSTLIDDYRHVSKVTAKATGRFDALIFWWDLTMTASETNEENKLTCAPTWIDPYAGWRDHWMQAVYYPPNNIEVNDGEPFYLLACHDEFSWWFQASLRPFSDLSLAHRPACDCGLHRSVNRRRMAMNANSARRRFFLKVLMCIAQDKTVLVVGDLPTIILSACSLGIVKKAYILGGDYPREIMQALIECNGLKDRCIAVDEDIPLEELREVDLVFTDMFLNNAVLPWDHAMFRKISPNLFEKYRQLSLELPKKGVDRCFPWELEIFALPVRFKDFWKTRAPVVSAEWFSFRRYDNAIQVSQKMVDDTVEPVALWQYNCVAGSSNPVLLAKITLSLTRQYSLTIENQFVSPEGNANNINGIVFWTEYNYSVGR